MNTKSDVPASKFNLLGFGLSIAGGVLAAGIADASLAARASRAMDSHKYGWQQEFEERIHIGNVELDQRYAFFGTDADTVRDFLAQPSVRANLLGLKHVDLTLTKSEARLDDPFLTNVWGLDGQPLVDLHNRVAGLLTWAARAM